MTKQTKKTPIITRLRRAPLLIAIAVLAVGGIATGLVQVHAQSLQEQINALNAENDKKQNATNTLEKQATNYADAINRLRGQIASIESAIAVNEAKQAEIQKKINIQQQKLDQQKEYLAEDLKVMYVNGDMSAVEMLATSKNLSDFVDAETYRSAVQAKIQSTLAEIAKLQNELQAQKAKVQALLENQKQQEERLAADRAEQNRLLAMNQNQRANLNKQMQGNAAKIAELQQRLIIQNSQLFGGSLPAGIPGGGGYKYGNAHCLRNGVPDPPCGQYDWGFRSASSPRNLFDEWGYGYRNCTSYVAFKLDRAGKTGFSGLGNATDWPSNTNAPKSYGKGARPGDAAVRVDPGGYGHVMYVEAVSGGMAYVSDYNAGGDGLYRPARPVAQSSLVFIHFR